MLVVIQALIYDDVAVALTGCFHCRRLPLEPASSSRISRKIVTSR